VIALIYLESLIRSPAERSINLLIFITIYFPSMSS
jgi:hypothetical protein